MTNQTLTSMKKDLKLAAIEKAVSEQEWSYRSDNLHWTEETLARHADRVDWDEVSKNTYIKWTREMVERFKDRINWHLFSQCCVFRQEVPGRSGLGYNVVEALADLWDWTALSANSNLLLSDRLINAYRDRWSWPLLIQNICDNSSSYLHFDAEDFVRTYIDKIEYNDIDGLVNVVLLHNTRDFALEEDGFCDEDRFPDWCCDDDEDEDDEVREEDFDFRIHGHIDQNDEDEYPEDDEQEDDDRF